MKMLLRKAGLRNVNVSSAGTAASQGCRASHHADIAAGRMGLSLTGFRSKPLTQRRVRGADLILTMGKTQQMQVVDRWPEVAGKTHVISEFSSSGRGDIDDPMGRAEQAYFACAADLDDETKRILRRLKRLLKTKGMQV